MIAATLEPVERIATSANDSVVLALVLALTVLVAVNAGQIARMMHRAMNRLVHLRRRENVFDERVGGSFPYALLLDVLFAVSAGVLLYAGARPATILWSTVGAIGCMLLAGVYYLFQLAVYNVVGFAFTSGEHRRQWIMGLEASQQLVGLALLPAALLALLYPQALAAVLPVAALLYATARVMFIIRGFRIFYDNLGSLFYFILYLCSVEIIPLIYIGIVACKISAEGL